MLSQPIMHEDSTVGRRHIKLGRIEGDFRLVNDYFAEEHIYPEKYFSRRFACTDVSSCVLSKLNPRVCKPQVSHAPTSLFAHCPILGSHDEYFVQKRDADDVLGLSQLQKVTTARLSEC
ncbi:hypothetical protein PsorP6_000040 [Peronosclerospora sorghi]|uniref:Uncharacterized protein n=1 Tax=Peronosclerospora sorghi TaxID=230839 RepID=A0ACC0WS26_9STRA|nr:hypothetical protein PsorP6_000040 [Peronosclerospora sorghi]